MLSNQQIEACRRQFPALARNVNGKPAVYLDGPGGTQVPQRVIDAVGHYLAHTNANHGGCFATSVESDAALDEAQCAMADLVGCDDPDEIAFGPNMTTLTFALSRSLARTWRAGDEVVVTRLDHDANVSPWVLAARDAGATVKFVDFRKDNCTLDLEDLRAKLSERTKLVAVGCASNATGTINPVADICAWARDVGALTFLDAVHFAPHALIDVKAFGCDFLVCSAYKFFGPHVGVQWGRREILEELTAYKVRPAANSLPGKWMTGTQNHEGIVGALEAVEYLADLGRWVSDSKTLNRRLALRAAYSAIGHYERELSFYLIDSLERLDHVKIWGITDPSQFDCRLPTVSITHRTISPRPLAKRLAEEGIFVWSGNYYALEVTESLDLEPEGMVRIGLVHYNTKEEIDRLLRALRRL